MSRPRVPPAPLPAIGAEKGFCASSAGARCCNVVRPPDAPGPPPWLTGQDRRVEGHQKSEGRAEPGPLHVAGLPFRDGPLVVLPQFPEAAYNRASPMPSIAHGPAKYLVVADDDPDTARALRTVLEIWGFEVLVTHDGEAALAAVSQRCPDAVLLDLALPKLDGLQVARRIRELCPSRPVLLLAVTGYSDQQHRLLSREAGFDDHLVKPLDPATLRARLREA
jgi:CheY-like chemotaxis protein